VPIQDTPPAIQELMPPHATQDIITIMMEHVQVAQASIRPGHHVIQLLILQPASAHTIYLQELQMYAMPATTYQMLLLAALPLFI